MKTHAMAAILLYTMSSTVFAKLPTPVVVNFVNGVGNDKNQAKRLAIALELKIKRLKLPGFKRVDLIHNSTAALGIPGVSQVLDIVESAKQRGWMDKAFRNFADYVDEKYPRKPGWFANLQRKVNDASRTEKEKAFSIFKTVLALPKSQHYSYINGAYKALYKYKGFSRSSARLVKDIAYFSLKGIEDMNDNVKSSLTSYHSNSTYKDYNKIYDSVRASIDSGKNVLMVGHSQGNIFSNMVLEDIGDYYNVKMISVANAWPRTFNGGYNFTWKEDLVMKAAFVGDTVSKYLYYYENRYGKIWGAFQKQLPGIYIGFVAGANKSRLKDATGHGFEPAYLNDSYAGRKILARIKNDYLTLRSRYW